MGYRIVDVKDLNDVAPLHRVWNLLVGDTCYVASYVSEAFDSKMPECMVFACDDEWNVTNWEELAVSYIDNPGYALAECMEKMGAE